MAYINTLTIQPQESANALIEAMAQALGEALGWTVDGTSVWQDESKNGLRFCFIVPQNGVYVGIGNEVTTRTSTRRAGTYGADVSFCVDYIKTNSTVAVGVRMAGGVIALEALIAKNTAGTYKAMMSDAPTSYYLAKGWAAAKSAGTAINSIDGISTSIVRFPDFWGGCMYNDLYLILSCPFTSTDNVFYIDGKYYRRIGSYNTAGFAVPVG